MLIKPQFIMAEPNLFIGKSACFLVFPAKQHIFQGRNHHVSQVSQVSWRNGMLFTVKPPWAQVCTSDHKPISSTWSFMAAPVFQIPTSPATKVGLGGILMGIFPNLKGALNGILQTCDVILWASNGKLVFFLN